jgi:hypothetical protein
MPGRRTRQIPVPQNVNGKGHNRVSSIQEPSYSSHFLISLFICSLFIDTDTTSGCKCRTVERLVNNELEGIGR